jgi:maleylacetate reductase
MQWMFAFSFKQAPLFLTFGAGELAKLPDAVRACDGTRALLVASPSQRAAAARAETLLEAVSIGRFDGVAPHVPGPAVEALVALARDRQADVLIALGGGAAIDLCKAAASDTGLQVVAVPTTYGGSELTMHAGRTDEGRKSAVVSGAPRAVIYDPELTYDLPRRAGAGSAMNALAHCVEALYAPRAQPLALLAAEEGLRRIPAPLRAVAHDPHDAPARSELLLGAYLAAVALAGSGMALHHRICHVLGGTYGIAHGDANAVILPHVARFNAPAAPDALATVARALGVSDAATGLAALARDAGAATTLAELGLDRNEFETIADHALAIPLTNPRPVDRGDIVGILEEAWS